MERKEAIEVVKKNYPHVNVSGSQFETALRTLIPELKESEDEKIRKALLRFHKSSIDVDGIKGEKIIAWLEKQGGQKEYTFKSLPRLLDMIEPTSGAKVYCQKLIDTLVKEGYSTDAKIVGECLKKMNGEDVPMAIMDEKQGKNAYNKELSELLHKVICRFINDPDIPYSDREKVSMKVLPYVERLERQDRQKSFDYENANIQQKDFAPKVEPKFKVGDFIVNDYCMGKVIELTNDAYLLDTGQGIPFSCEHNAHIWDISKDAKPGDVLCSESGWTCIFKALDNHTNTFSSYCFMDSDKWFCNTGSECHTLDKAFIKAYNGEIYPATKEQRDLLFQKMKEAGYEWDSEKKELKKIEQKQVIDYPDNFPKDNWELIHEFVNKFGRIPKDEDELNVLIEYVLRRHKSAWSEDDENMLKVAIESCEQCGNEYAYYWLESLKNRVQPQQEWNYNDEIIIGTIIQEIEKIPSEKFIDNAKYRCLDWLKYRTKSLRPQNRWKPSDDEMKALADALSLTKNCGEECAFALRTLYEQLKKLKG